MTPPPRRRAAAFSFAFIHAARGQREFDLQSRGKREKSAAAFATPCLMRPALR
jgi:hypothetical protein